MDMSPRCLGAGRMFSGQGGAVYAEMAPERAWIAGGALSCKGSPAHFTEQQVNRSYGLSGRFAALCSRSGKRGSDCSAATEPFADGKRTHAERHQADIPNGSRHHRERQQREGQLTSLRRQCVVPP